MEPIRQEVVAQIERRKVARWNTNAFSYAIPRRGANFALFSVLMDLISTFFAFLVAELLAPGLLRASMPLLAWLPVALVFAIRPITFAALGLYDSSRRFHFMSETRLVLLALGLSLLALLGSFYLIQVVITLLWVLAFAMVSGILLVGWRLTAYVSSYASTVRSVVQPRRILIVGANALAQELVGLVEASPLRNQVVAGFLDNIPQKAFAGYPVIGTLEDNIFQLIQTQDIDEVIVAGSLEETSEGRGKALRELKFLPVPVRFVPRYLDISLYSASNASLDALPLSTLRQPAMSSTQRLFKRAFDIAAAGTIFLMVLPVFLVIYIAIKLDSPGPAFFLQDRVGEYGRKFKIYKFRSMVNNAERLVDKVKIVDENGNTIHKVKNDFRVTRIGKIIRKTSLDELPQLLNVLRGDMSLVGPRPEVLKIVREEYHPWQYQRFLVPQGITGWWQVNGRSDNPCHLSTDQDLYYIENYSFWLDIRILFMTIPALLRGKGAF